MLRTDGGVFADFSGVTCVFQINCTAICEVAAGMGNVFIMVADAVQPFSSGTKQCLTHVCSLSGGLRMRSRGILYIVGLRSRLCTDTDLLPEQRNTSDFSVIA